MSSDGNLFNEQVTFNSGWFGVVVSVTVMLIIFLLFLAGSRKDERDRHLHAARTLNKALGIAHTALDAVDELVPGLRKLYSSADSQGKKWVANDGGAPTGSYASHYSGDVDLNRGYPVIDPAELARLGMDMHAIETREAALQNVARAREAVKGE